MIDVRQVSGKNPDFTQGGWLVSNLDLTIIHFYNN